jgi:hypothetical protein
MTNKYENIDFDFGCPSRFDLEDAITKQMEIVDNLNTIMENVIEGENVCEDPDYLVNTLQGIVNLHEMKHAKLWSVFTALFRLDEHNGSMYTETVDDEDTN